MYALVIRLSLHTSSHPISAGSFLERTFHFIASVEFTFT